MQVRARAREEAVQRMWRQRHLQAQPCQVHLQAVQRRGQRRDLHPQPVCTTPLPLVGLPRTCEPDCPFAHATGSRDKYNCTECGGNRGGICEHNRRRARCKECGGGAYASTNDSAASARSAKVRADACLARCLVRVRKGGVACLAAIPCDAPRWGAPQRGPLRLHTVMGDGRCCHRLCHGR